MENLLVTNREICEWFKSLDSTDIGTPTKRFEDNFCSFDCHSQSLYSKITKKVISKCKLLKRNKKYNELETFLDSQFVIPRKESNLQRAVCASDTDKERRLLSNVSELQKENKSLKRKLGESVKKSENFESIEDLYFEVLDDMKVLEIESKQLVRKKDVDLAVVQQKFEEKSEVLAQVEAKLQKCKPTAAKVRRLNRKIVYRNEKLVAQKTEIESLKVQLKSSKIENECLTKTTEKLSAKMKSMSSKLEDFSDETISTLKKEKHATQKKITHLQKKLNSHKNDLDTVNMYEKEMEELDNSVSILEKENKDLQKFIAILEDPEIITFENGRYNNEVREVIMELLSLNVSMSRVNDVIKCVISKLTKKSIRRLPSAGVRSRLINEALILSQVQVKEAMESSDSNCLHGDGTSKYHRHYQNFQITTSSGKTLSFGLAEISGVMLLLLYNVLLRLLMIFVMPLL